MKQPTGRALRAPLAGSPACVFAFVFVLIYVQFELIMKVIDDDDDIVRGKKNKRLYVVGYLIHARDNIVSNVS